MEPELREELRRFLKERRSRIRPADAGLPTGLRRRVPGLRREEVASLAGIGVSWYTDLENGDAEGVSDTTLLAVARALRLSPSERDYLLALAGRAKNPTFEAPSSLLIATMNALAFPAYVITPLWELIDSNEPFRRIWGVNASEMPFNAIERLFIDPRARKMHGKHYVANFTPVIAALHSSLGRRPNSTSLQAIRDRIVADEELQSIWDEYEISNPLTPTSCTIETSIGTYRYETLTLPVSDLSQAVVVQVPDTASAERLRSG
jgi:transcriptional regulator with XRE-family HTH domain